MISILVFFTLIGGLVWLRIQRSKVPPMTVEEIGFIRTVFPDGTIEDQNENGDLVYVFDEKNSLRVTPQGTVFRIINNEPYTEDAEVGDWSETCGPQGEKLSSLGITQDTPPQVFHENPQASQKLLELVKAANLNEVEHHLRAMSEQKYLVEVEKLFVLCVLEGDPKGWTFLQERLNYIPSKQLWEKIALQALEIKPQHLDVISSPLQNMFEMTNKEWITNKFISQVLAHRRYDVLEATFKYGSEFRTHAERMCYYAYQGENIALMFMEESGSTVRALALYLAARNEKAGIAKSFVRSFTKDQQQGLKKMFSRLKNNPQQVLTYFS